MHIRHTQNHVRCGMAADTNIVSREGMRIKY